MVHLLLESIIINILQYNIALPSAGGGGGGGTSPGINNYIIYFNITLLYHQQLVAHQLLVAVVHLLLESIISIYFNIALLYHQQLAVAVAGVVHLLESTIT